MSEEDGERMDEHGYEAHAGDGEMQGGDMDMREGEWDSEWDGVLHEYEERGGDDDDGREAYASHTHRIEHDETQEKISLRWDRPMMRELRELVMTVDSEDPSSAVVQVYLKITKDEFIKTAEGFNWWYFEKLSRILRLVAALDTEEADEVDEIDQMMQKMHEKHDEVHEMNEMLTRLGVHASDRGLPDPVIAGIPLDMSLVAQIFDLYNEYNKQASGAFGFFSQLNKIRLLNTLPKMLSRPVTSAQHSAPSPIIDINNIKDSALSYTPYISYFIRETMYDYVIRDDWAILFHAGARFDIQSPIPHLTLMSLKDEYTKLNARIKRVVFFLNVDLGPNSLVREICMMLVVCRSDNPIDGIEISALDEGWVGCICDTPLHYMCRMSEVGNALAGIKPRAWSLIMSDAACTWYERCVSYMERELREKYGNLSSIKRDSDGVIGSILHKIWKTNHQIKTLEHEVYMCMLLCTLGEKTQGEPSFTKGEINTTDFIRTSVELNQELHTAVLSGYCLLSPTSVKMGIKRIESPRCDFIALDAYNNAPSETFAWAVSYDGGKTEVYALRHDLVAEDIEIYWTKLDYSHHTSCKSRDFLYDLMREAAATTDTRERKEAKIMWDDWSTHSKGGDRHQATHQVWDPDMHGGGS